MKPAITEEEGEDIFESIRDLHGDDDTVFGMLVVVSADEEKNARVEILRMVYDDSLNLSKMIPVLVESLGQFLHTINAEAAIQIAHDHDCGDPKCEACRSRKDRTH